MSARNIPTTKAAKPIPADKRANSERLTTILIAPHVSEKASRAADANQYVFRVRTDSTKQEIRAAVELMFDVTVEGVQVVNCEGKAKRFGRFTGRRNDWKKAYVSLAQGQTIDFAGAAKP